jgi:urea transporter
MKTNRSILAVIGAVLAVAFAILLAPVSDSVKIAGIVGFGVVVTLLTLAVMEYGRGATHPYELR